MSTHLSSSLELFQNLCTLHEHGIAHNDFDVRNVLLSDQGQPKIIDFAEAGFHRCGDDCSELKDAEVALGLARSEN